MLKKLSPEKLEEILEMGVSEFAQRGMERASMNAIAKKSGVSVGVLYKYYKDKNDFFMACLKHSLIALENVIDEVIQSDVKLLVRAEMLIRAIQKHAREHSGYNVMYHEITAGDNKSYAKLLAEEIEGISAKTYSKFISAAQTDGDIRQDIDPRMFAFFFDNLLMMLQFSYSCEYYRERFKIYCGDGILDNDEKVASELLKFFESAFTTEQRDIVHK